MPLRGLIMIDIEERLPLRVVEVERTNELTVQVSEARNFVRKRSNEDNKDLESTIKAVQSLIEYETKVRISEGVFDAFYPRSTVKFRIQDIPFVEVVEFKWKDQSGEEKDVDYKSYQERDYILELKERYDAQNFRIRYKAGHESVDDIPNQIPEAVKHELSFYYNNRSTDGSPDFYLSKGLTVQAKNILKPLRPENR
jgi:hypothetical protein